MGRAEHLSSQKGSCVQRDMLCTENCQAAPRFRQGTQQAPGSNFGRSGSLGTEYNACCQAGCCMSLERKLCSYRGIENPRYSKQFLQGTAVAYCSSPDRLAQASTSGSSSFHQLQSRTSQLGKKAGIQMTGKRYASSLKSWEAHGQVTDP